MARENLDNRLRAEQRVKADDTAREKFVSRFYNQEWDNSSNFDLVIDTNTISIEMATNWMEAVETQKELAFLGKGSCYDPQRGSEITGVLLIPLAEIANRGAYQPLFS